VLPVDHVDEKSEIRDIRLADLRREHAANQSSNAAQTRGGRATSSRERQYVTRGEPEAS